ncbi:hypothetical protein GCM10027052_02560 [Parafrigoribacterium mesophilum]
METATGLQRLVLYSAERIAIATAHTVLAVSPSLKQALVKLKLSRPEKVVVVGEGSSNGVDVREFDPARFSTIRLDELRATLGLRPGIPTIGYVGRLTRDKGFDVLENAVLQLREWGIEFDLLIVGGIDDPSSRKTLDRLLASGLCAASTGAVQDPAIYFQLMDLLCLPTYREGYPNVVLEAGASGKPTITTDATGAIDSVLPGVSGVIVPAGDCDALARELRTLLANPDRLESMGSAASRHVKKHFDRPAVWQQLQLFYASQYDSRNE